MSHYNTKISLNKIQQILTVKEDDEALNAEAEKAAMM